MALESHPFIRYPNAPREYLERSKGLPAAEQLYREALLARQLHGAIAKIWSPEVSHLLGPVDLAEAPDGEPWDTMRKLLRRYPTVADCDAVEERLFQRALRDMRIAHLTEKLTKAETRSERQSISRQIDELRSLG